MQDYYTAQEILEKERKEVIKSEDRIVWCEQAQEIVQTISQQVQQKAHKQIGSVVSRCLEAIFDDPYKFKIHFERKRGRTEARLVFIRDREEIVPLSGAGGGVIDVAAFALRIASILLTRPPSRRIVILDEPFKHLKPASYYGSRIVQLIKSLAKDFKIQFIMVQNLPEFQAGKIIEIEKD